MTMSRGTLPTLLYPIYHSATVLPIVSTDEELHCVNPYNLRSSYLRNVG